MSRMGTRYEISRPSGLCASTGRPLEPGDACIAALCEREDDEGFDRLDFSAAAWDDGARPEHLFSYWRTVIPEPDTQRKLLVDDEVLMDVFERLAEDDRPQRIAFRFVLALILMRKRLLRFVGRVETDDTERWQFRTKGADPEAPSIEVVNPKIDDDDVREITDQLSEILQGEF